MIVAFRYGSGRIIRRNRSFCVELLNHNNTTI